MLRLRSLFLVGALLPLLGTGASPLRAAIQVQLTPSLPAPKFLGTRITWTATVVNSNPGPTTFRFEVASPGSSVFFVRRDFSLASTFEWTPSGVDGMYRIRVTARDYLAGETAQSTAIFQALSLVVGSQAAVIPTAHPLVALFSAPTCPAGSSMRVSFQRSGSAFINYTDWRACHPGSMNFYIGGMPPLTLYRMNYEVQTGSTVTPGPTLIPFTTGPLPSTLQFPATTLLVPPTSQSAITSKILLTGYAQFTYLPPAFPVATDLFGHVNWYYSDPKYFQLTRPLAGGTMLVLAGGLGTGTGPWGDQQLQQVLQEIDLAGNSIRETNADRVSEQLLAMGTDPICRFHHDAIRLPNKNILVLGDIQRIYPAGTQGSPVPVNIIGDIIIELDQNWQVVRYWNTFDHAGGGTQLDINRRAVRGEVCVTGKLGCPPILLTSPANDWLHANSIQYLASDDSLIMSLRNQDWVIKIDYSSGGAGNILWRMGKDGDFTITSSDPYPWFSGQHDAAFESDGTLSVFDNGNARFLQPHVHSRGQVYNVNEAARTTTLQMNVDLGVFSPMLGSAQRLPNGNFLFLPGYLAFAPGEVYQRAIEVPPASPAAHVLQGQAAAYRNWRLTDFYTSPEL